MKKEQINFESFHVKTHFYINTLWQRQNQRYKITQRINAQSHHERS